jgi:uncharacterized protein (DUF4213/DUF364 family)
VRRSPPTSPSRGRSVWGDLHAIRLDDIREIVYNTVGIATTTTPDEYGDYDERAMTSSDVRKTVNQKRRKVTPQLLKKVAEIHRAAPEGRKVAAVKAAFRVHERTALRYIAAAKDERFIS